MWFTGQFSIPEPVLQAQREGRLVLFVGAGASMGAPSLLPDFGQLATDVALEVGAEVTSTAKDAPDKFLTGLEERGYPVHDRIAQRVARSAVPNAVHRALVRLFPSVGDMRVVTTNYDQHLTTAASELFGEPPLIYRAPALPLGRDFTGIVHLHGCLDQRPQDLVATFGDFGRAYLTDAWATRFLQEMFRSFTVLFVGYSNDDQIMQYLARGLPPGTQRFGLSGGDAPPAGWEALGITAVTYPSANGHAALGAGLERWAEVSRWGQLQHERKIIELVTAPDEEDGSGVASVPTEPGDLSYLESVFKDDIVEMFTRHAQDPIWLAWASSKPAFMPLFQPGEALDPVSRTLAWWFGHSFAVKHPADAWSLVRQRGGVLHPETARAVAAALQSQQPAASVIGGWMPVLLTGRASGSVLSWLLCSLTWPEHQGSILLLLDHLLAPQPQLGLSLGSPDTARFDLDTLTGDEYSLRQAWGKLSNHLDEIADRLLPGLERHLRNAHLTAAADRGDLGLDGRSLQRSAIEPHAQDADPTGFDLLIDIARDCSEHLAATAPGQAASTFESWIDSGVPLLQRLAVHGTNVRPDLSAHAKIDWLLTHKLLYATAPRHEVFRLITAALPEAGGIRADLLTAVLAGPDTESGGTDHDERRAYAIYNLLSWVCRSDVTFAEAEEAFTRLQAEHPGFSPTKHPDLYITFEPITPHSPLSAEQMHLMVSDEDIDWLLNYEGAPEPGSFADRWALLPTVTQATAIDPSWGLTVAKRLIAGDLWQADMWPRLLHGWTQAGKDLTEDQVLEILKALERLTAESGAGQFRDATVRLLLVLTAGPTSAAVLDSCETPAGTLMSAAGLEAPDAPDAAPPVDWVAALTDFWLQDAYQRWTATEETLRAGIPQPSRHALDTLLADSHPRRLTAVAALARNLVTLVAMDEPWTTTQMLPAFDWTTADASPAPAAWTGYLARPLWNERVLELLLPSLLKSFTRITDDEPRDALITHTANLCLHSASAAKPETGMITAFFGSSDADDRELWAGHIGWQLSRLPAAAAEGNWERWIKDFWRGRLNSLPRPLDQDETGKMLDWVLPSGTLFPTAVELLVRSPSRFKGAFLFFRHLKDSPVLTTHPAETARLVAHVLSNLEDPAEIRDEIGTVLETLIALDNPAMTADLRVACNGAARAGCASALEWADKLTD